MTAKPNDRAPIAGPQWANPPFVHIYQPPRRSGAATLLLLHGTGGDETDLLPIAPQISADAGVLSVRGQVLENGMPRFFRRMAMGVFDEADVRDRAAGLAAFVHQAAEHYKFDITGLIAVGFSNGANIAAAVIWNHPPAFRRAILFRAMLPYRELKPQPLQGSSVLITAGRSDPMISADATELLATRLREAGADVDLKWQESGHNLTQVDISAARQWLEKRRGAAPSVV